MCVSNDHSLDLISSCLTIYKREERTYIIINYCVYIIGIQMYRSPVHQLCCLAIGCSNDIVAVDLIHPATQLNYDCVFIRHLYIVLAIG